MIGNKHIINLLFYNLRTRSNFSSKTLLFNLPFVSCDILLRLRNLREHNHELKIISNIFFFNFVYQAIYPTSLDGKPRTNLGQRAELKWRTKNGSRQRTVERTPLSKQAKSAKDFCRLFSSFCPLEAFYLVAFWLEMRCTEWEEKSKQGEGRKNIISPNYDVFFY